MAPKPPTSALETATEFKMFSVGPSLSIRRELIPRLLSISATYRLPELSSAIVPSESAAKDFAYCIVPDGPYFTSPTDPAVSWRVLREAVAPGVEAALGRGPTFALVVLLVVLVATITLSLLLGGDPSPGRGLS